MLQRFNAPTNYSGFSTSVRSTRLPFAMLKPLTVKNRQLVGGFAKSSPATGVGRTIKRGSGALMNSVLRRLFSGVRKPWTRERKYQTRLGSWNSTAANCIFGCNDVRDTWKSWYAGKNRATMGGTISAIATHADAAL